jgi:pyrroloquinoline quinone biosynthesis protein B
VGRHSPIFGVVLVSADVDGLAGLVVLRERQALRIFAPPLLLDGLRENRIFGVLDPTLVEHVSVSPGQSADCGYGLRLTIMTMPGKTPLYLEDRGAEQAEAAPTYAARIEAHGRSMVFAPACAEITDGVLSELHDADAVLFDGTVFRDDEMIVAGVGSKTGRRMGHVPMSGPDGSLARLAAIRGRRVYLHVNNTNPVLLDGSPERQQLEAAGFELAFDGMEIRV